MQVEGWRAPATFRARRDCRDGFVEVRAASAPSAQSLSSISAITSHNHEPVACAAGKWGSSSVLALYRQTEAGSTDTGSGLRQAEGAPRLQLHGQLVALPGHPTAVAWSDQTLACGLHEGTVEVLRFDPSARDDHSRARRVAQSLQPQLGATASSEQTAAGTSSVAVGVLDGKHARRIGAVVGGSPCLWDAEGSEISLAPSSEAGSAHCLDLDWDKGSVLVGDGRHLSVYDPRHSRLSAKVQFAHFAALNTVCCSHLHPHWVASGSADGVVKVWDMRRLEAPLFRLAWHLTSISGLAWSWANAQMLVSCAHDGSHRFWNLRLSPHFELCNADSAWAQRELVGCSMLAWPGCPHDSLAASSDGLVQVVRLSGARIIQPLARLEAADRVTQVLQDPVQNDRTPKQMSIKDMSAVTVTVSTAASQVQPIPNLLLLHVANPWWY